ncbi:LysR family transcriptional regulator [Dyella tabacisoli]|uniref:LysR family transcriptional regulator n=1 Tax=Dyella tabacisoli TaxID=2282381 RepID=A0A369UGG9_9GAMM|nr:LysR family transcriptional regulator [Dyella tabacisoli]RDD79824.1 LysR family transcriptional regulator [Dyella tabacisoli]
MKEVGDINLNRLVVFVAVVEAGTLAGAARRLGVAKALVTAHIQKLETELRATLLVRTTRSLNLTEAGKAFFEASRSIVEQAEAAIESARCHGGEATGTLRITAPMDYAGAVIAPVAAALTQLHPSLRIDLVTADRVLDLVAERVDVGIRLGWLADSSHQAVKLGSFALWLVASPALLRAGGVPQRPRDLSGRPMAAFSVLDKPVHWTFAGPQGETEDVRFDPMFTADSVVALRQVVLAGAGFGVMTDFAVSQDIEAGRLIRVLPQWKLPVGGIYAVFPASTQRALKVKVFIDALRAHVQGAKSHDGADG